MLRAGGSLVRSLFRPRVILVSVVGAGLGVALVRLAGAALRRRMAARQARREAAADQLLGVLPPNARPHVRIDAADGVVVLRGRVDDVGHLTDLRAAARRLPGVIDVVDLVTLSGAPLLADAAGAAEESRPR